MEGALLTPRLWGLFIPGRGFLGDICILQSLYCILSCLHASLGHSIQIRHLLLTSFWSMNLQPIVLQATRLPIWWPPKHSSCPFHVPTPELGTFPFSLTSPGPQTSLSSSGGEYITTISSHSLGNFLPYNKEQSLLTFPPLPILSCPASCTAISSLHSCYDILTLLSWTFFTDLQCVICSFQRDDVITLVPLIKHSSVMSSPSTFADIQAPLTYQLLTLSLDNTKLCKGVRPPTQVVVCTLALGGWPEKLGAEVSLLPL